MNQTRPKHLLSIGEFSRHSRLSQKALRLYDALGLLMPSQVDEQSGYRYYLESQLERAKLIGLLRQLEMPLNQIAEVLELRGEEISRAIARYWAEVESDLKTKRRLVQYLEEYLGGKGERMYKVETREVHEQKVATIQRRVYAKELPRFIGEAGHILLGHLGASGLKATGAMLVIYHGAVNEDSAGPVEVCVPFEGSLEPKGQIAIRMEAAHSEAYTRITKAQVAFPGILKAYDAVAEWLKANKLPILPEGCSPREVYFAEWDKIGPDDPACDIAYPYS